MSASRHRRRESLPNILLDAFLNSSSADESQLQNAVQNVRSALQQLQSIDLASYDAIQSQNARLMESVARAVALIESQEATCARLRAQRDDLRATSAKTQDTLAEAQKKTTSLKASMRVMKETLSREQKSHLASRQKLFSVSFQRDELLRESELAAAEMNQLRQQLATAKKKLEHEQAHSASYLHKLREALRRERKASASAQQQSPPRRYETRQAKRNREMNAEASTDGDVDPDRGDSDEAREAALRESIEKLRRIQEQENRDRLKRKREHDDEEEKQRQERAKRQRLAEEQEREMRRRQAEEEQRRQAEEAQRRQQEQAEEEQKADAWRKATKQEEIRCQKRDIRNWTWPKLTSSALPSSSNCLARFIFVLEEFSGTQYSETQPVTISSVPWPVLLTPRHITFDVLDETKIRAFFAYAKTVHSSADYKKLLSKARIQFHPDKWRSRNLLKTIMKEGIRETMESTVTVVSQTLNALFVEA